MKRYPERCFHCRVTEADPFLCEDPGDGPESPFFGKVVHVYERGPYALCAVQMGERQPSTRDTES